MFDFFEGFIENLELKLIDNFSDKVVNFINNTFKSVKDEKDGVDYTQQASSGNYTQQASSGNYTQQASSGNDTQQASSGNYTKQASSGDCTKQASSGNYTQQASSGDYTQQASSGNDTQQASSGNDTQQASSGNDTQQASSGNDTQQASSGDCTKQASSGDYTQQASSGDYTKQASSGNYTQQASSGYGTQQASSGNYTKQASSGNYTQQASSGDYTKQASSGNDTQQASSGDYTQQASSGDYTQHEISGKDSISFACGYQSIIKAKKGTWISLAEYKENEEGNIVPFYALSAQIGNKEYKDFRGRILKETEYYCLHNKNFYPVDISDDIKVLKMSEKKRDNIKIIKGETFDGQEVYIAKENSISAHGKTLKKAMEDLTFKKLRDKDTSDIVKEIKRTGKVTRMQYRAITGACQFGTEQFCKQHNIEDLEEIDLEELRKILINDYGAERFWRLIDKENKQC